jgi:hypothetical protein
VAWLGGNNYEISILSLRVTIPTGADTLRYWYWIVSQKLCFYASPYDKSEVRLSGQVLKSYEWCQGANTGGWREEVLDLTGFRGQTQALVFKTATDYSNNGNFFLDDVVLTTGTAERVPIVLQGAP